MKRVVVTDKYKISKRIEACVQIVEGFCGERMRVPMDRFIQLSYLHQVIEAEMEQLRPDVMALIQEHKRKKGYKYDSFSIKVNGVMVDLRYEGNVAYRYNHSALQRKLMKMLNIDRLRMRRNRMDGKPEEDSALPIHSKAKLSVYLSGYYKDRVIPDHKLT